MMAVAVIFGVFGALTSWRQTMPPKELKTATGKAATMKACSMTA